MWNVLVNGGLVIGLLLACGVFALLVFFERLFNLHRAQIRTATPRRWRDKDLASLYFSALDIGLTQCDRLRFLRGYFDRPLRPILRDESPLLRQLEHEAERLQQRYLRKYAEDSAT